MSLYKNKNIIITKLTSDYFYVINPLISDGGKLLTNDQVNLINSITDYISEDEFLRANNISYDDGQKFVQLMQRKDFLNKTGVFKSTPIKENKNLDLWIHTTDNCNLRCSYCYIHTKNTTYSFPSEMLPKLQMKIINSVKKCNLKTVSLRLAGGEPLIKFDLWARFLLDLRSSLENINCKLRVSFLSNLTILNSKIINLLKEDNINIGVSLDGIGKINDKTRYKINGEGSFSDIEKNLDTLIANNIKPSIMTVVSNYNLDGLYNLTGYLIDKKLPFRFSFVHGQDINTTKLDRVLRNCYNLLEKYIEKGYKFSNYHSLCDLHFKNVSATTCGKGFNSAALYTNGDIYFCQKQFGVSSAIGNINEKPDFLKLVKRGNVFLNSISKECLVCKFYYICSGGCPLDRVNGKARYCKVFKKYIPIVFSLIGKEKFYSIKKYLSNDLP